MKFDKRHKDSAISICIIGFFSWLLVARFDDSDIGAGIIVWLTAIFCSSLGGILLLFRLLRLIRYRHYFIYTYVGTFNLSFFFLLTYLALFEYKEITLSSVVITLSIGLIGALIYFDIYREPLQAREV